MPFRLSSPNCASGFFSKLFHNFLSKIFDRLNNVSLCICLQNDLFWLQRSSAKRDLRGNMTFARHCDNMNTVRVTI